LEWAGGTVTRTEKVPSDAAKMYTDDALWELMYFGKARP
jgi:hypothetical protein